jgi:chaperone required for assembly of F1-ATPase
VLRTPARNPLHLPTKELAMAIAAEWDAQTDENKGIEPVSMPLMTLASTAIDQIQPDRSSAIATCLKYLPTDSALFFTHDGDRILLSKQRKHLAPVVRWVSRQLRVEIPTTTEMVGRIPHTDQTMIAFETMLEKMVSIAYLSSFASLQFAYYDEFTLKRIHFRWLVCKTLRLKANQLFLQQHILAGVFCDDPYVVDIHFKKIYP